MLKESIRILLTEIVDYAGLFPPASLEMEQAVANYALYREDPNGWMLARPIVLVARLAEFEPLPNGYCSARARRRPGSWARSPVRISPATWHRN